MKVTLDQVKSLKFQPNHYVPLVFHPRLQKRKLAAKLKQTSTHTKSANPSFESNESVALATLSMAHSKKTMKSASSAGSVTSKSVPHSIHPCSGNVKSNFVHNFDFASYRKTVKSTHSSSVVHLKGVKAGFWCLKTILLI